MILYHGSDIYIEHPDISHSRSDVDFGIGFYLTPDKEMAALWASRKDKAVINVYDVDIDKMATITLGLSKQWLEYVAFNRGFSNKAFNDSNAELIIGPTADDRMMAVMSNLYDDTLLINRLTTEEALFCLDIMGFSNQYVIKKQGCIDKYVQPKDPIFISPEKQNYYNALTKERRRQALFVVDDIIKNRAERSIEDEQVPQMLQSDGEYEY